MDCKNRWKSLRDSYNKSRKTKTTKSGQAADNWRPWNFEKQMEFLSNVQTSPQKPAENDVELEEVAETLDELPQSQNDGTREITSSQTCNSLVQPASKRSRTSAPVQTSASTALQEYLNYKRSMESKKEDHLTKHFDGVEETVRIFPPHLQIKIKSQISTILHSAEYEALQFNNSPQNFANFVHKNPQNNPQSFDFPTPVLPVSQMCSFEQNEERNISGNSQTEEVGPVFTEFKTHFSTLNLEKSYKI